MDRADNVVAIDIGGTSIKSARIAADGSIECSRIADTPEGADSVIAEVIAIVEYLRTDTTVVIGICAPGIVDPDRGVIEYAANLGFVDTPLRDLVHDATGLPVFLQHDVRAACIAESRVGHGGDNVMVVVLGTGLAAAFTSGGRLVRGHNGIAGEFGHIPIVTDGERCGCGQYGCLEAYSSAGGLLRRYRAAGGICSSAADIAGRVPNEELAQRIWGEGTSILGRALVTAAVMLDPSAIVLAGGLTNAGRALLDPVVCELELGLSWRRPPPVRISELGSTAGTVGSALHALDGIGLSGATQRWTRRGVVPAS